MEEYSDQDGQNGQNNEASNDNPQIGYHQPPPPPLPLSTDTPGWMSHIPALPITQLPRAPVSFSFGTSLAEEDDFFTTSSQTSSSFSAYLQNHHPAYALPPAPGHLDHQEPSVLPQSQVQPPETTISYSANPLHRSSIPRSVSLYQDHGGPPDDAVSSAQLQMREFDEPYNQNDFSFADPMWSSSIGNSRIPPVPQDVQYRNYFPANRSSLPNIRTQSSNDLSGLSAEQTYHSLQNVGHDHIVTGGEADLEAGPRSIAPWPGRDREQSYAQTSQDDNNVSNDQQESRPRKQKQNHSRAMANIDPQLDHSTAEGANEPRKPRKEKARGRPKGQKTGLRPTIDPGPEFMTLYNEAMDAFIERDDVLLAQTKVLQAIGANPEIFAAHSLLADIHFAKGDHDKALDALMGGLHAHMNDVELWRQVADTILTCNHEVPHKRVERAMYCFGAILRKDPTDLDARFQRAECARILGYMNRAFKDLDILLQDDPHNSSVLAHFTKLCQDVNNASKAKLMYDEHFEYYKINGISEYDSFTWQDVGVYVDLIAQAGEIGQAIIVLKRLSRWLCGRREEDFWEEYLEDDREFDQNHYPRRLEVPAFEPNIIAERDYGEALPLDLRAKLGILRLKLNYHEEAQSHFDWLEPELEEEESLVEEYSDTFLEIAKALFEAKEHKEALRFYSALENSGVDLGFEFWIGLGASAYICEQRIKAIKAYEQAMVANPSSIEARTQLAKLYRDLGDRPNALKYGREAVIMSQDAIPQTGNRKYENRENRLLREAAERALKGAYRLPTGSHGVPGKIPESLKYRTRMKSKFFKYVPRDTEEPESDLDAEDDDPAQSRKGKRKKFGPPKRPGRPKKQKTAADTSGAVPESDQVSQRSMSREPEIRTKRRYKSRPKLLPSQMDPQKHYEDMQTLYRNLLGYQPAMREGDEEATSCWIDCAQAMIDDFRTVKAFYPGERHQKFTGYTTAMESAVSATHSPTPGMAGETPTMVENSRSSTPIQMVNQGISNGYCGISFHTWLDIFLELALIIANSGVSQSGERDLQTDCYSVINAAIDCNVFYHHPRSLLQIYVVYLSCCLALNDDVTLYNTVIRWFMNEFTFCTDTYRLYSTVALLGQYSNAEGKSRIEGSSYRASSNQKFLFRQLCSIDQQLPRNYGVGTSYGPVPGFMRKERNGLRVRKGGENDDQPIDKEVAQTPTTPGLGPNRSENIEGTPKPAPISIPRRDRLGFPIGIKNFSPKEMDVVLFILYAHIMMANNSFTNALNYLYRAHSLDPSNTVCLLSIALCYLTELFKRQVGNRHAMSLMGWMWFGKYETARRKWAEEIDEQNAERTDGDNSTALDPDAKMIDLVNREIEFNKARCWEMMGMPDLAVRGYKKVLALPSTKKEKVRDENSRDESEDDEGLDTWDMEAAYAMSTIYMINGDGQKAREIVERHMVVE